MKSEEIDKKIGMPDIEAEWQRFEHDVIDQHRPTSISQPCETRATGSRSWMGRAAAILLVCVVTGLVWAATRYLHTEPVIADTPIAVNTPATMTLTDDDDCEVTPEEDELLSCWDKEEGMYVFDNKELQLVVDALRLMYDVSPVFVNEESRHIRLYFTIVPQERSIEEMVTILNTFYHVKMRLDEDKLIIE